MIFSLAFTYMFYEIELVMSVVLGILLFIVGLCIYLIPRHADRYHQQWLQILNENR